MILENIVPPVPSEAIMGMAGIAVAKGELNFWAVLATGTFGTLIGNLFWWEVGRRTGYERLRPHVNRWSRWLTFRWSDIERMKRYFDRFGGPTIFVFRFLPFGRTMISLPAGMMRMPFWRFVLYTFAGSAIWNTMLISAGVGLGKLVKEIEQWTAPMLIACVVGFAILYTYRVVTWKPDAGE